MQRTLILIVGLIVMALLAIWCLDRHVDEIQMDILGRANDALVGRGLIFDASVSGQDVTLSGMAATPAARNAAAALIADLTGVRLVDNRISIATAPATPAGPYSFLAEYGAGQIVLSGSVQNDAERASIVGAARQVFRGRQVIDQLVLRDGAPAGFAGAVKRALPRLAQLEEGRLMFTEQRVSIAGVAAGTQVMEEVESGLAAGLTRGYSASARLSLVVPSAARIADCQSRYDRVMAGQVVRFATGSARISADSFPLLDEIAVAAKTCAGVAIEVQGHTDSQGAAKSNLALSQRRAESVVDYLSREGVATGQLVAKGYGEAVPVAGNDTAAGRASNRRIDFRAGVSEDNKR